jgi:hypothetical protein
MSTVVHSIHPGEKMYRMIVTMILTLLLLVCSCNLVEDTTDTAEGGGEGAVGIAEKMSGGTLGDTDYDSGESNENGDDDEIVLD